MAQIEKKELSSDEILVQVKELPQFKQLKAEVDKIVVESTWWEKYGPDNLHFLLGCVFYIMGFYLMGKTTWNEIGCGILLIGFGHSILSAKIIHLAAHGSMGESNWYNRFCCWFAGDFIGMFPTEAGYDIHIKMHHPHTNIIGLGDSSTWKMPFLPRWIYMFLAPLLMPLATPIVGLQLIIGKPLQSLLFVASAGSGLCASLSILKYYCGYTWFTAFLILFASRAVFSCCYIHINIFQHIGLPMYSPKNRPARLFQMSSGVLNLHRNFVLDLAFGHSLISCHVEHHLFPRLSDNLCMKIKPIVSKFLLENNLPYNEDYYYNRLKIFMQDYDKLMVNAPPVWHYVGLQ